MESLAVWLIFQIGLVSALAYVPLQWYVAIVWRGGWRLAALVPLILMVPVFVITAMAVAQESNLAWIFVVFLAPVATGYLVILWLIRRFVTSRPNAVEADRRHD